MRRILASAFLSACIFCLPIGPDHPPLKLGEGSRYMVTAPPPGASDTDPFAVREPRKHAILIYLPGSTTEPKPDACDTSRPGRNIPFTITDLAGVDLGGDVTLSVFAFCTLTKVGGYNQKGGDKIPKVILRAWELQDLLLAAERAGIPPNRVFVAGQSAGAWAGLLVQRWGQARMGGLIAFAPAFSGFHQRRRPIWQLERDRQVAEIAAAEQLNALVYGFHQDRFEPPVAMTWLSDRPDITYVATSGWEIAGVDCENRFPHTTVFKDCFRNGERERILSYIREQLLVDGEGIHR